MEYCEGGELYGLLTTQPSKRLKEAHMRFYVAEVRLPPRRHASCIYSPTNGPSTDSVIPLHVACTHFNGPVNTTRLHNRYQAD